MKIIVCPDSFKGSLSAKEAAEAMSAGIRDVFPEVDPLHQSSFSCDWLWNGELKQGYPNIWIAL